MSLAVMTPRLRSFVFCDEVVLSDIEDAVYNLEGAREQIVVDSFPHWHSLNVFLALAYFQGGSFRGQISLIQDDTEEIIQDADFFVSFDSEDDGVFLPVELGSCIFPEPGGYTGEIWFFGGKDQMVQKGQRSILLIQREG